MAPSIRAVRCVRYRTDAATITDLTYKVSNMAGDAKALKPVTEAGDGFATMK
jgi:hypothetical protein